MTLKDLPGTEPDLTYSYDLLSRMTGASQTNNALSFSWDALGRNLIQGETQGVLGYGYDVAGGRTSMIDPTTAGGAALTVNTDYDAAGNVTVIRENGATNGAGVLATYGCDSLGRRASLTYGNGVVQS